MELHQQSAMDYKENDKRSVKVIFYKNGDQFFPGVPMHISSHRYRNMESLLNELTRTISLPRGVRYVMTPSSGKRIQDVNQLEDGKVYVCSSFSLLNKLEYGKSNTRPVWRPGTKLAPLGAKPVLLSKPKAFEIEKQREQRMNRLLQQPRVITFIKCGPRPRKTGKILLNRKTGQTFDQLLSDISETLRLPSNNRIKKLYSLNGKVVRDMTDLLGTERVFIVASNEGLKITDLEDIMSEVHSLSMIQASPTNFINNKAVLKPIQSGTNQERNDPSNDTRMNDSSSQQNHYNFEVRGNDNVIIKVDHDDVDENNSSLQSNLAQGMAIDQMDDQQSEETSSHDASSDDKSVNQIGETGVDKMAQDKSTHEMANDNFNMKENQEELNHLNDDMNNIGITSKENKEIVEDLPNRPGSYKDYYEQGTIIGDGNFAEVFHCVEKDTLVEYALKLVDKNKIKGKEAMMENEINIMKKCRHKNIIRLIEVFDTETEIQLIMELVKGGDLFEVISEVSKFTEFEASGLVKDLASAIQYLHHRQIIHRDLKPENLLIMQNLDETMTLKLGDFGLANVVTEPLYQICGTPTYVAPEILSEVGYGLPADLWATGVITYILLCGFPPFRSQNRNQKELFDIIKKGEFEYLSPYWDDISDDACDLIDHLLIVNPITRYTADQVLLHQWIKNRAGCISPVDLKENVTNNIRKNFNPKKSFKAAALAVQTANRFSRTGDDNVTDDIFGNDDEDFDL